MDRASSSQVSAEHYSHQRAIAFLNVRVDVNFALWQRIIVNAEV
jgi:hypothetical protein